MSLYTNEDRFSMTAERYLAKHHVLTYMEDSIAQLLENREENPKINSVKILSEYFTALRDGNHTMFREYQFIHATPHNRASFVKLFWKCYKQIGKKGDLLSIQEYHSLITLLCSDFPFEIVQKTARIILMDDALDCLISFADFIYAFQTQFYYEEDMNLVLGASQERWLDKLSACTNDRNTVETSIKLIHRKQQQQQAYCQFLDKCLEIYQSMMQTHSSPRNPVVVPSGTEDTKIHMNNHLPGDGVDAMQYFRAVYPLCDRMNYSTPLADALKEILFNVPRVSFYGFLMAISKSDAINEHIGRLPSKSELLEGPDIEITPQQSQEEKKNMNIAGTRNYLIKKRMIPVKSKSATDNSSSDINNSNPVVTATKSNIQQSQTAQQPRSRSVSRSRVSSRGQGHQTQLTVARTSRKKVISSEESSDESDDDDDDSDDD